MTIFVWLLLCVIWGTTWIFIKEGLTDLPPILFAALRFAVSCLILLPILLWQKLEIPKDRQIWRLIILTGLLQFFFNYGLLFWGEQFITSGLAAVLQAIIPVFGLFLARIFVGEEITLLKIISILLGLAGLVIIFYEQLSVNGTLALLGSLAVVTGAFGASLASVLTKAKLQGIKSEVAIFWQMFVGQIPLWMVGYWLEGSPAKIVWTWKAIVCILYLAVFGSIVAFWLYYWLLSKIDVTKAMMIAFVTPLVAVFVGSFFGEKLGVQAILGGMLILGSVGLIVVRRN
jgi:drug/metabolite transporter (DMT)-like permease